MSLRSRHSDARHHAGSGELLQIQGQGNYHPEETFGHDIFRWYEEVDAWFIPITTTRQDQKTFRRGREGTNFGRYKPSHSLPSQSHSSTSPQLYQEQLRPGL